MKGKMSTMSAEQIIFRQMTEERVLPDNWYPELRWVVEYHRPAHDFPFPLGMAWVMVPPESNTIIKPIVEMVLTLDQFRRQGVATKLVQAIVARWPNVMLTEAISDAGYGFLQSLEAKGIAT